jgi:hypothetical protein
MNPAVALEVCLAELREYLAGYRGYPPTEAGEKRFAAAFQENCVSVGHVRAVLKSFEEQFPTVRQIHDVALNLRPQFEPQQDAREEWKRDYGKPEPFDKYPSDELACHWQAFRDMLYYNEGPAVGSQDKGFWESALFKAERDHAASVAFIRNQAKQMGWSAIRALSASPVPFPYENPLKRARRARAIPQVAAPITQEDIERAEKANREKAARQAEPESQTDDEGWTDPDR